MQYKHNILHLILQALKTEQRGTLFSLIILVKQTAATKTNIGSLATDGHWVNNVHGQYFQVAVNAPEIYIPPKIINPDTYQHHRAFSRARNKFRFHIEKVW